MKKISQIFPSLKKYRIFSKGQKQKSSDLKVKECWALDIYRPKTFNFTIISPSGLTIALNNIPHNCLGIMVKRMAIEEFLLKNNLKYYSTRIERLSKKYKFISVRQERLLPLYDTLSGSNVQNYGKLFLFVFFNFTIISSPPTSTDEFHLSIRPTSIYKRRMQETPPTQTIIDEYTDEIELIAHNPPTINFEQIRTLDV